MGGPTGTFTGSAIEGIVPVVIAELAAVSGPRGGIPAETGGATGVGGGAGTLEGRAFGLFNNVPANESISRSTVRRASASIGSLHWGHHAFSGGT